MHTELIGIVAFCVFWTVVNTFLMARVTRLMSDVADMMGRQTFADIVGYEQKMGSLPDEPAVVSAPEESRVWNLMRDAYEDIQRRQDKPQADFPWTPEQCREYWRSQELVLARERPDMPKSAMFDALVDKMVIANMWGAAPKQPTPELPPIPRCIICDAPGVMHTRTGSYCGDHTHLWRAAAAPSETGTAAPFVPQATLQEGECNATDGADFCDLPAGHGGAHSWEVAPASLSEEQLDAFQNMIHGR